MSRSSAASRTRRELVDTRRCESRTTRSSGRRRGRPVRSVSCGLSARTVPMPVSRASGGMAKLGNVGARRLTGKPEGLGSCASFGRRRNLAVQGHGCLEPHKGSVGLNREGESVIEPTRSLGQGRSRVEQVHLNSGVTQDGNATPTNQVGWDPGWRRRNAQCRPRPAPARMDPCDHDDCRVPA